VVHAAHRANVELPVYKDYQGDRGSTPGPNQGRNLTRKRKAHNRMVNSVHGPG
jgi:hypothetical protein